METKEICQKLNQFLDDVDSGGKHRISLSLFCDAADRLEEQEAEIAELKQQLSEKQPEWISVEDRLPESEFVLCTDGEYCFVNIIPDMEDVKEDGVTHWMPLPEPPKPKEPTFKDVFLKAFPKANIDMIGCIICVRSVFAHIEPDMIDCAKYRCPECWNQPYFEEEGEADA